MTIIFHIFHVTPMEIHGNPIELQVLAHVHTGTYNAGPEAVAMMRLFCGVCALVQLALW